MKLDQDSGHRYRIEEIDAFLANIDEDTEPGSMSTKGPFSTFPGTTSNHQLVDDSSAGNLCFPVLDSVTGEQRSGEGSTPIYANHDNDNCIQTPTPSSSSSASNSGTPEVGNEYAEDIGQDTSNDDVAPEIPATSDHTDLALYCSAHSPAGPAMTTSATLGPSNFTPSIHHIATSLFGDGQIDLLINHYNFHIADLMQPIFHTENVFRGIYLSTALKGSVIHISDPNTSKALVYSAIYHSLLASSAFHLWNCNTSQTKYQRLGVKHRYQALAFLQAAIEAGTPGADYQIFMIAMLSLLSIGTLSGEGNDFTTHINAATQLRSLRGRWKVVSRSTQKLNSISAFLAILARTTCFQPIQMPGNMTPSSDDNLVQSSTCYEHIYGVTPSIVVAIQETCHLAELLVQYKETQSSIPDEILQACEALGERLLSWRLISESIMSIPSDDDLMFRIFTHQANAWHRAALIYYYRRIQSFSSVDLVDDVQYVAEQMHGAEDLKVQVSQDQVMAPITWPGFIASCEAIGPQRDYLTKWWDRIERYKIGNTNRQWEIVQQLWKRDDEMRQSGLGPHDWIDSFRVLQFHVLAV
ncbi:hypothetical protein AK830_g6907 [Neonectria ditissima]|uniref:Transcription factor domain-containing protein n=1 Tax=Neonectria ditissima TaxID=78410 RepID=A0A0P7BBC3_9HYPO|nr:hypothetical protein AK830_g6907 [Neonectria ditissima]